MIDSTTCLGPEATLGAGDEHGGVSSDELPFFLDEVRQFQKLLGQHVEALAEEGAEVTAELAVKDAHSIKSLVAFAGQHDLVRLCHVLEEALQELLRRQGSRRRGLYKLIVAASDALASAFDAMECRQHVHTPPSVRALHQELDARVRGMRLGAAGEEFRVELHENLRAALCPPARVALLAAMAEGLQVVEVERRLPADRALTPAWAAQAPSGTILARTIEPAGEGVLVRYLVLPGAAAIDCILPTDAVARPLPYARRPKPGVDPAQLRLRITPEDEAELRRGAADGEEIWIVSVDHPLDDPIREGRSRHVFEVLRELGKLYLAAPDLQTLVEGEEHGAFRLVMGSRAGVAPLRTALEATAIEAEWALRPFVFTAVEEGEATEKTAEEEHRDCVPLSRRALRELVARGRSIRTRVAEIKATLAETATGIVQVEDLQLLLEPLLRDAEAMCESVAESSTASAREFQGWVDRVARAVAQRRGRSVRVRCDFDSGTRLPRKIADRLKDPLLHLVRNAVDHGIETVSERTALGKSSMGTVSLAIASHASRICFEVADDGRGIDEDALRRNAPPEARTLGDLVFSPGVSTAAEVDEISGRGMGMSIARDAAQELGGSIEVASFPGRGTRIRIEVPETLGENE